jgi:hypothetical protein
MRVWKIPETMDFPISDPRSPKRTGQRSGIELPVRGEMKKKRPAERIHRTLEVIDGRS